MKGAYFIPAGSSVLVLRNSDAPDCWQPHVTRIDLAFDRPVRFADPVGALSDHLVFRRGEFLIAVPSGVFERKAPPRQPKRPAEPSWKAHAIKWGELSLLWPMPGDATAHVGR